MKKYKKELLSGNEAAARGAYEGAVTFATGYPGTPSTEILENIAAKYPEITSQWSVNEKTALEIASGASFCGARSVITMKHVGLNVALDPLMTLSYLGVNGGLIIVVSDDPGQHSSQTEQDTRHLARFAKVPIFEPSDSQEAKDYLKTALDVSEKFDTPVIYRLTTRVSHSKGIVELGERENLNREFRFERNPQKYVPVPIYGRILRKKTEERLLLLKEYSEKSPLNKIIYKTKDLGIITSSIAYQYAAETFPEASILKLGMCYPFPDRLFYEFANSVKEILVVEELENFIEEHVRSLGIKNVYGKEFVPICGELNLNILEEVKTKFEQRNNKGIINISKTALDKNQQNTNSQYALPVRAPVLCPGCPHTGIFYALKKERKKDDLIVAGDIGCYSLAVFPPLDIMDTIICMGGGFTVALGMKKSGTKQRIVGVLGDSTFFHSGITGLIDTVYNNGSITLIVLDNNSTAMTGHQEHPGTGKGIHGESTIKISIEEIARASGVRRVRKIDPYDIKNTRRVIKEELEADEPSVIISEHPCKFVKERQKVFKNYTIDLEKCKGCSLCLELGCPALERIEILKTKKEQNDPQRLMSRIRINTELCDGCGMCFQICKQSAIEKR